MPRPGDYIESADPTVNDDTTQGFKRGWTWTNSATGDCFKCTGHGAGSASWKKIASSSAYIASSDVSDFTATVGAHADVSAGVTHAADATKHRIINDGAASATELWSASKISGDLATKSSTSHSHALADLSNVVLTGPSASEHLEYDGANWVNAAPAGGGSAEVDVQESKATATVSTSGTSWVDVLSLTTSSTASKKYAILFNALARQTQRTELKYRIVVNGSVVATRSQYVKEMGKDYVASCQAMSASIGTGIIIKVQFSGGSVGTMSLLDRSLVIHGVS